MKLGLLVVENFLDNVKGDIITDAKKIKQYLESEWQNHFVKIQTPAEPATE